MARRYKLSRCPEFARRVFALLLYTGVRLVVLDLVFHSSFFLTLSPTITLSPLYTHTPCFTNVVLIPTSRIDGVSLENRWDARILGVESLYTRRVYRENRFFVDFLFVFSRVNPTRPRLPFFAFLVPPLPFPDNYAVTLTSDFLFMGVPRRNERRFTRSCIKHRRTYKTRTDRAAEASASYDRHGRPPV